MPQTDDLECREPSKHSANCSVIANSIGWAFGYVEAQVSEGMVEDLDGGLEDIAGEIRRFLYADCFEPGIASSQLKKMADEARKQDAGSLRGFSEKVSGLLEENIKDSETRELFYKRQKDSN